MELRKRDVFKLAAEVAVGSGVGIIVNSAINAVVPPNLGRIKTVAVKLGSYALVWAVTEAATAPVSRTIDNLADGLSAGRAFALAKNVDVVDSHNVDVEYPNEGADDGGR